MLSTRSRHSRSFSLRAASLAAALLVALFLIPSARARTEVSVTAVVSVDDAMGRAASGEVVTLVLPSGETVQGVTNGAGKATFRHDADPSEPLPHFALAPGASTRGLQASMICRITGQNPDAPQLPPSSGSNCRTTP